MASYNPVRHNSNLQVPNNNFSTSNDSITQDASYSNYPPPHRQSNPSYLSYESNQSTLKGSGDLSSRSSRTPSPTPSEDAALKRKGLIDWKTIAKWRFWFRREWLWYYVALVIILIVVALVTIYDKQIVRWLQPTGEKIRDLPAGWLIPIAIFFIISFPPLFGHEILGILVGLIYGLWIGFAITSAGTYLGEVGNFYAFKYLCKARGEKMEKSKIQYACLAKIVRDGGFRVALVARYSAIPGHFTTAIFATCGMNILVFSLAAILSLPKQFVIVYIGVVLKQEGDDVDSASDRKNKIISNVVLAITIIVTILAMWYLTRKMDAVKHDVIRERRKTRQAKLEANLSSSYSAPYPGVDPLRTDVESEAEASDSVFNPQGSEANLPLNHSSNYQRWDSHGRAVGSVGDPNLVAPQPSRPPGPGAVAGVVGRIPTFRTESGGGFTMTGRRYEDPVSAEAAMRELTGERSRYGHEAMDSSDSVAWETQRHLRDGSDATRLPMIRPSSPLSDSMDPESLSMSAYHGRPYTLATGHQNVLPMESLQVTNPFASSETLITGNKSGAAGSDPSSSRSSPSPFEPHTSTPLQHGSTTFAPPLGPPPGFR